KRKTKLLLRRGEERKTVNGTLGEFKTVLANLLVDALKRAKEKNNVSVDLLARLAVIKFLRVELVVQFSEVLECCRTIMKNFETLRHPNAIHIRECVSALQVSKKVVLRRAGQELFENRRE